MKVSVLRLGHREKRDKRITTHVGLAARALGASEMILSGDRDEKVLESIRDVSSNWGGSFTVKYQADWESVIRDYPGVKVHLTMYGLPIQGVIDSVRAEANRRGGQVLVIVGSEKVPPLVYRMSDFNVAVTNQPHSEVSSLAIFLDRLFEGRELDLEFPGASRRVVPRARGKKVALEKSG